MRNGYLILKKEGFQEILFSMDNKMQWITILPHQQVIEVSDLLVGNEKLC